MIVVPVAFAMPLLQEEGSRLLRELRTPVPHTIADEQIAATRARVLRQARKDLPGTFRARFARAKATRKPIDLILAVAVGSETIPRQVVFGSRDFWELVRLMKVVVPGQSLEYRRAAFLLRGAEVLAPPDESLKTDPNGAIRRALLAAYPDDPMVWRRAAGEVMYVSRFTGPEEARRISAWWSSFVPPDRLAFPQHTVESTRLIALIGVALATKSESDVDLARVQLKRWSAVALPSDKGDIKFYSQVIEGILRKI